MGYAAEHAGALVDISAAGAAVTFTYATAGTYDAATDTYTTPTSTTVSGSAMQVRGTPEQNVVLGLVESEAPTLLFAPTTYGGVPEPGYTVSWNSVTYTVKAVTPVAPDGTVILARVVVAR